MTEISSIRGADPKIKIEIDDKTGKWIRFIVNPTRKTLREVYNDALDDNTKLTDAQRTELKTPARDPTR